MTDLVNLAARVASADTIEDVFTLNAEIREALNGTDEQSKALHERKRKLAHLREEIGRVTRELADLKGATPVDTRTLRELRDTVEAKAGRILFRDSLFSFRLN